MCSEWKWLGRNPLWAKLSKSPIASQVPDLGLNGLKLELQHFPVRGFARCGQRRLRLGERQLKSPAPRLSSLILGLQRWPKRLCALRFFLLRFDRLAFEAPSHVSI